MKFFTSILCIATAIILSSCSSSQQTSQSSLSTQEQTKKDSLYVFDQIPTNEQTKQDTTLTTESSKTLKTYYVVQIGAFTTKERAQEFADHSKAKIKQAITIKYRPDINLYVVQLAPAYTSHEQAENARNEIWKTGGFSDAWISTEQK